MAGAPDSGGATPVHDWVRPRLTAMVRAAEAAGIERGVAIAVIADLITSPPFNDAQPTEDGTD